MELTLSQVFEIEKLNRDIDNCNDITQLKELAKQLLHLTQTQKASSRWLIQNSTPTMTDHSDFIA
jgi:uncharacterized membrane protein YjjP (DUF1212 family)